MKSKLLFVFILFTLSLSSQESVNQKDINGKKHGIWIVWLDKDWKLAKDSMSAVYFRYNYFIHGKSMYAMGAWGGKLEAKPKSTIKKGNAVLLDGEYNWYNSKGKLVCTHALQNGWYTSFKEYHSNGQLQTYFDYTEHYSEKDQEQKHTYAIKTYNKKGRLKFNGWSTEEYGGKGVDN